MADAAAPAPELKEYPEFPGQKLSKRYVYCVSCCRCHHHRHHHHHHHHHRLGFLHICFRNTHLLLLSHIKNTHKTLASTKKCSRDKKRTKKKPQKLPPRCDYWEAFESSFIKFKDESVEALLCFFFKKRSPLFCPPCCDRFIKTSFVFSVLRHMVVVVGKKKYWLRIKWTSFFSLIFHTGGERKESTDEDEIRGRFRGWFRPDAIHGE